MPSKSSQPSRTIEDIKTESERVRTRYAQRDTMDEEIRQMFHLEWQEQPKGDWIKATMSPSAYNAVLGAVRLMTSTEPQINVPFDEVDGLAKQASEKIESACKAMWNGSGRVSLRPVHYDAVFSAILFGEICASVTRTQDLVDHAAGMKDPAQQARMEAVAAETPFLFQVYNPATCYPEFDSFGLRSVLRRVRTVWGEVLSTWGDAAEAAIGGATKATTDIVVLNDYWDWEVRAVWVEEANEPIWFAPHGLKFLPFVCQITDGTSIAMFADRPELQRLPLLYAVWKSGLWKRENLSLTTIFSLMFALGSNPLLVRNSSEPGAPLVINRTIPGGVVDLNPDEKLQPLMEKIVDPSQLQGLEKATALIQESTINKYALGNQESAALSYSAINLLTQSGRLPLTGAKQMGGQAIGNLLVSALKWYRDEGGKSMKFYTGGKYVDLAPNEVGERPVVNVNLEPDLPQDKLQLAQIGSAIKEAGLASDRWIMENILQIGQPQAMKKEIWFERRQDAEMQKLLAQVQAQGQMAIQQAMQQAQAGQAAMPPGQEQAPGGAGPGEQGAQAIGQGAAPTPSAMPPGGQVGPGAPLSAPLPTKGQTG